MERIIVGVDGSAASRAALRWAAAIGRPLDAEVIVVNAWTPVPSELKPSYLERLTAERFDWLSGWCEPELTEVKHRFAVPVGDPRNALPEAVEAEEADLLVIASTGSSGAEPGFLHLGSVAEMLVHHTTIPLAVLPPGCEAPGTRALLATDGSDQAGAAARWLASVAPATGHTVLAVTVVDDADAADLDEWTAPLAEAGLAVEPRVITGGPPAVGILDDVADRDADLVVMGMRGTGTITGMRLGSVATRVLRRAEVPVVLIPDPAS